MNLASQPMRVRNVISTTNKLSAALYRLPIYVCIGDLCVYLLAISNSFGRNKYLYREDIKNIRKSEDTVHITQDIAPNALNPDPDVTGSKTHIYSFLF